MIFFLPNLEERIPTGIKLITAAIVAGMLAGLIGIAVTYGISAIANVIIY